MAVYAVNLDAPPPVAVAPATDLPAPAVEEADEFEDFEMPVVAPLPVAATAPSAAARPPAAEHPAPPVAPKKHSARLATGEKAPVATNAAARVSGAAKTASPDSAQDAASLAYWSDISQTIAGHLRYPRAARLRGVEGTVLFQVTIGLRGDLLAAVSVPPVPDEALCKAGLEAIRRAAPFRVPAIGGAARERTAVLPIHFRLQANRRGGRE